MCCCLVRTETCSHSCPLWTQLPTPALWEPWSNADGHCPKSNSKFKCLLLFYFYLSILNMCESFVRLYLCAQGFLWQQRCCCCSAPSAEEPQRYELSVSQAPSLELRMRHEAHSSGCCQRCSVALWRDCGRDQWCLRRASSQLCRNHSPVRHPTYCWGEDQNKVRGQGTDAFKIKKIGGMWYLKVMDEG